MIHLWEMLHLAFSSPLHPITYQSQSNQQYHLTHHLTSKLLLHSQRALLMKELPMIQPSKAEAKNVITLSLARSEWEALTFTSKLGFWQVIWRSLTPLSVSGCGNSVGSDSEVKPLILRIDDSLPGVRKPFDEVEHWVSSLVTRVPLGFKIRRISDRQSSESWRPLGWARPDRVRSKWEGG